jgi:PPP family 3-phenylpropionic acid transporter
MSVFFAGYFLVNGVVQPFFPVWLQARGMSPVEIGNIIAIPALVRVFATPLAGAYADRAPNRRFAIITFTLPAALVFLLAWPVTSFWLLLPITGAALGLSTIAGPPSLALAMTGVRRYGVDFGRMRMVGTIAFAVANVGSGALLGILHPEGTFWLILLAMGLSAAASFALPVTSPAERAADDAVRKDPRPSREVLGNYAFLALMVACALNPASQAMLNSFGSIEWHRLGFTSFQTGILWATGLVCEVAVFMWSGWLLRRLGVYGLLMLGAFAAVVRWSLFPLQPAFAGYALLQAMHGLTFGANALGTQHLIARLVPERMTASAQGIYAMIMGVLLALTTAASGPLYQNFGAAAFLFMVPIAGIGLLLFIVFRDTGRE